MQVYQQNIKKYQAEIQRLKAVLNKIALLRLLLFVVSAAILITLFSLHLIVQVFVILPFLIFSFGLVIKYYDKIAYQRKQASFLKQINEGEIKRGKSELEAFDTGEEFIDPNHYYTSDLDIFGAHSIFQLVDRTTTESGKFRLSEWLREAAPKAEILDRQAAIQELAQKLDWRQVFQASGRHFQNKESDYQNLLTWVEEPIVLLKKQPIYYALAILLPILFGLSAYFFFGYLDATIRMVSISMFLLAWISSYLILSRLRPQAENIVETSTKNLKTLSAYQTLIHKIETESFESKKLKELKSILLKEDYSASDEIEQICKTLEFSYQRPIKKMPIGGNYWYSIMNSFLLLDIYLILRAEKWKAKNKAFLRSWAEAVSEFEVINSFAGFAYSNPSYAFPELTEKDNYLHFEDLGHPLIPVDERVCNDFHSAGYGQITMVTGSNMGGKSTFLRSVGVNLVLALAGAPCCAKSGELTKLKLFTSMRTQDNLMRGISSFYAELNRIEKMLKLIENNQNTYFLLDEVFKGTNSKDRHKGGFSLINQLSKLHTSGIIATHDIELAKLAGDKKLVDNYSFNSEIKEGSMIFSYKLHPTICHDFNASELMKKSGIEILPNILYD